MYFAKGCKGDIVREIQEVLVSKGYKEQVGTIDGIYGQMTEAAVKRYQEDQRFVPTGRVDEGTWSELMGTEWPSVFRRAFQLTTAFEGHGYSTIAGNFDNRGLSFGCLQYNLGQGTLQSLLKRVPDEVWSSVLCNAQILEFVVQDIKEMLLMSSRDEQILWADGISLDGRKYLIDDSYYKLFVLLGGNSNVQQLQRNAAKPYWSIAKRDAKRLGMSTDVEMALLFDIAVQNGGVKAKKAVADCINYLGTPNKMEIVTMIVANRSTHYAADVLTRKLTITIGTGTVHGREYILDNWGLSH